MPFLDDCVSLLSRTPLVLRSLLETLPESWTQADEGPGTWNPPAVLGHLIHGEHTDWIPRLEIILRHGPSRPFDPFDMQAHFQLIEGKSLGQLLDEFAAARQASLDRLCALHLQPAQLDLQGTHPSLGPVTARQLLATWTAHDLAHLVQVSRTLAKCLKSETGPWAAYMSVMK